MLTKKDVNKLLEKSGVKRGGPFTKAIRTIIVQAAGAGRSEDWIINHVPTTEAYATYKSHLPKHNAAKAKVKREKALNKLRVATPRPSRLFAVPDYRRGDDPRYKEFREGLDKINTQNRERREAWEQKMAEEASERNARNAEQRQKEARQQVHHDAIVEKRIAYIRKHIPAHLMPTWALWHTRHNEGQPVAELVAAFLAEHTPAPVVDIPVPEAAPVAAPKAPQPAPQPTPRQQYAIEPVEDKYRQIQSRARRQQSAWAKLIKEAGICMVTGSREGLEAAHIKPFAICTAAEAVDLNNGVCLTATVHKIFDSITSIDQIAEDEPMRKIMDMDKLAELLALRQLMLAGSDAA
ncbi:hypothetical protein CTA21_16250 [Salmonella enterica]|nr:hypothetical protein [Salmonella enterica]EDZ0839915.1 HNH endonuclease [Salmonella enterica subsp. enterica serovar Saintpaul]EEC1302913.1 hypothetical protein [Salmonella enterica]